MSKEAWIKLVMELAEDFIQQYLNNKTRGISVTPGPGEVREFFKKKLKEKLGEENV